MARSSKIVTTTGAVTATLLANGCASTFYGICASNALSTAIYYVKLYWEGTGTPPPPTPGALQPATTIPVAATNIPQLAIPVGVQSATLAGTIDISSVPLNNGGRIWYWVSITPGDGAQSVLAVGGDVVTFIYD